MMHQFRTTNTIRNVSITIADYTTRLMCESLYQCRTSLSINYTNHNSRMNKGNGPFCFFMLAGRDKSKIN